MTTDTVQPGMPRVTITYCTQCNWLLRAAWMAQELLSTFTAELGAVTLEPGSGGVFRVTVSKDAQGDAQGDAQCHTVVWDRAKERGFPEITTLKQRVRDQVAPGKRLGHTDRRDANPL